MLTFWPYLAVAVQAASLSIAPAPAPQAAIRPGAPRYELDVHSGIRREIPVSDVPLAGRSYVRASDGHFVDRDGLDQTALAKAFFRAGGKSALLTSRPHSRRMELQAQGIAYRVMHPDPPPGAWTVYSPAYQVRGDRLYWRARIANPTADNQVARPGVTYRLSSHGTGVTPGTPQPLGTGPIFIKWSFPRTVIMGMSDAQHGRATIKGGTSVDISGWVRLVHPAANPIEAYLVIGGLHYRLAYDGGWMPDF